MLQAITNKLNANNKSVNFKNGLDAQSILELHFCGQSRFTGLTNSNIKINVGRKADGRHAGRRRNGPEEIPLPRGDGER